MSRWDDRERAALVALLRRTTTEKGERESVRRLADETSPVALLRERLGPDDLFSDPVEKAITQAREDIASRERDGIQVIALGDERYPQRLRDVFDRPVLLFARGTPLREMIRERLGAVMTNPLRMPQVTCAVCTAPVASPYTHCYRCFANAHRERAPIARRPPSRGESSR